MKNILNKPEKTAYSPLWGKDVSVFIVHVLCMLWMCFEDWLCSRGQSLTPELAWSKEHCDPLLSVPWIADKITGIRPTVRLRHGDANSFKYVFCFLEGLEIMYMPGLCASANRRCIWQAFSQKPVTAPLLFTTAFLKSVHSSVSEEY